MYTDLQLMSEFTMAMFEESLPDVQDTFFGLKLGSETTISQVKTAVGTRGTFLNAGDPAAPAPDYTFRDVYFAGKRWDYAEFSITPNGQFYQFCAYDSYPEYSIDEQQMASSTFNDMKSRLDSKYGEGEK